MITLPVSGYLDLSRRTTMVDMAESSLRLMQRDIRRALPNSIRITGGGAVIELLHTAYGGRYRSLQDGAKAAGSGLCDGNPADDILSFSAADNCFEVTGSLTGFNPQNTAGQSLVVYNLGDGAANAYSGTNSSTVVNSANAHLITFKSFQFPFASPQQRFFIVDTPITYRCDMTAGNLWRYSNYAIAATQPNPPGVDGQLQANWISSCSFSYTAGTASRSGLVTVIIGLTDSAGESVQLMHQIHVDNAP